MRKGVVSGKAIAYMEMEALSSTYGWTPDQVRSLSLEDILAYLAINNGRTKKQTRQGSSGIPLSTPQMRSMGRRI